MRTLAGASAVVLASLNGNVAFSIALDGVYVDEGGTIGMQRSADGYVPTQSLERLLRERPMLSGRADMPDFDLLEYPDPIDSSNAKPSDWRRIAGGHAGGTYPLHPFV